jgi:hypothetical protein
MILVSLSITGLASLFLLLLRFLSCQKTYPCKHQQSAPYSLNGSRENQLQHIWRYATPDGGKGEDGDANGKDAPSTKVITE